MVFNATFNNISAISWLSVLLLEETGGPGENHWPVASWDSIIWFNPSQLCACPKPGPEFPSHIFMSSSFFYSMSWGKRWLFVFFYIQWVEPEVRGDCSSFLYSMSWAWGKRWLFVFFYIQWVEPEVRGDCSSFFIFNELSLR